MSIRSKLEAMNRGECVEVTNNELALLEDSTTNEQWQDIKTANNTKHTSPYVAWFGSKGQPPGFRQAPTQDGLLRAFARPGPCR